MDHLINTKKVYDIKLKNQLETELSCEVYPNESCSDLKNGYKNEYQFSHKEADNEFLYENGKFSGVKFAHYLKSEGSKIPYNHNIPDRQQLPDFYDPIKFKRAQDIFRKYLVNVLFAVLSALMLFLLDNVGTKILLMTNSVNNKKAASIRYKNTFKRMVSWIESDFSENSDFWKSINRARYIHYSTNAKSRRMDNMPQITQLELAEAILLFYCCVIRKPEHFGMEQITIEEQEVLLHYGRVVGYLFGVQNRFNGCRESIEETKEIIGTLLEIQLKPRLMLKDKDSLHLQFAAIEGVAMFTLPIYPKSFLNFTYELIYPDKEERKKIEFVLSPAERLNLLGMKIFRYFLRFLFFRRIMNNLINYVLV